MDSEDEEPSNSQDDNIPQPSSGDDSEENGDPLEDAPDRFVTLTLFFEGSLALLGLLGGAWSGLQWKLLAQPALRPMLIGTGGGIALFFFHLILFFPGGDMNPFYRYIYKPFKESLLSRLPDFTIEDIIFIAIMSGIGEEILFRGWIQYELGIVVASILFGLIHIWGKEGIGYGLYAIGMGFVLGYLYNYTGNLWAPVLAHTVNNFLGLFALQSDYLPD